MMNRKSIILKTFFLYVKQVTGKMVQLYKTTEHHMLQKKAKLILMDIKQIVLKIG